MLGIHIILGIVIILANLSQYLSQGISESSNDLEQLPSNIMMINNITGIDKNMILSSMLDSFAKNNIFHLKDMLKLNINQQDHRNLERLLSNLIPSNQVSK